MTYPLNKKLICFPLLILALSAITNGQSCYQNRLKAAITSYNNGNYDDAIQQLSIAKKVCSDADQKILDGWIGKARSKKQAVNQQSKDTDGDGVLDNKDDCIRQKGAPSNNGCPLFGKINPNGFKDFLSSVNDHAFIEHTGKITAATLTDYYIRNRQLGLFPIAVFKLNGHYYSVWQNLGETVEWKVFLNKPEFPYDEMNQAFEEGYNIECLEKIEGNWFITLLKRKEAFGQAVETFSKKTFRSDLDSILKEGYAIQNIVDDGDDYTFLLTKYGEKGMHIYDFFETIAEFEEWKDKNTETGYNYLYCYKLIDNKYFAYMIQLEGVDDWTVDFFDGKKMEEIVSELKKGYFIDNIAVDNSVMITLLKTKE